MLIINGKIYSCPQIPTAASWGLPEVCTRIRPLFDAVVVWALYTSGLQFEGMQINAPIAFILGYAGGDVLENIYKILVKKPLLGPVEAVVKATAKK